MPIHSAISQLYKNRFETKCLQLLVNAFYAAKKQNLIQLDWEENDISETFRELIFLDKTRNPNPLINVEREYPLPTTEPKEKGFANKQSRIDFRLSSFYNEEDINYFFEAKRIKESEKGLLRKYVNEGLNRFTNQIYPLGSIIGYSVEGNISNSIGYINSYLTKINREKESLQKIPHEFIPEYFESTHSVGIIKHLIFDFVN